MKLTDSIKLMEIFAVCPKCGQDVVGNGKGTLECDTAAGYFKRTCGCGWFVEVLEGVAEAPAAPETPVAVLDGASNEAEIEEEPVVQVSPPHTEPEPIQVTEPEPVPEPEPVSEAPRSWNGFVHIRCEACHKETTTRLRMPMTKFTCRECDHTMDLPEPYRAYTRCECGGTGRYLTNIPDWGFDIPCVRCGAPNAVTYNRAKDCYTPAGEGGQSKKTKKKK